MGDKAKEVLRHRRMKEALSCENIWVPEIAESPEECAFFSVEITDGSLLSKEAYTGLFFQKIVKMVDDSRDDDLIEDLESYFPSLFNLSDELSNEDLALMILEAEEFYFGFPPINEGSIKCVRLQEIIGQDNKEYDFEDFANILEGFKLREVISFVTERHDSFLSTHSEYAYDRDLSSILSNPGKGN